MTRTLVATLLFAAVASPAATVILAQQRDRTPPPAASGRISGTIVDAESGRPVRFAAVSLTGPSTEASIVTGDTGAFAFDRLSAGSYRLQASKRGYLNSAYGQIRPGTDTAGKRIPLADREAVDRLVIPLSHGGSISGVVRDDYGDPIYQANVRVSRWVMRNGARTLETVDTAETDERGRYRVSLLPPREYVVSALPSEDAIPETKEDKKAAPAGFAPVFYPSSLSARGAETLPLGLGEDRGGIDLQLTPTRLGRVTGLVLDADGQPARNMSVVLVDREHADLEHGTETDAQGRFTFDHVVPGPYLLQAGRNSHSKFVYAAKDLRVVLDYSDRGSVTMVSSGSRTEREMSVDEFMSKATPLAPRGSASTEVAVTTGATAETLLTLVPPRAVRGSIALSGTSPHPVWRDLDVELRSAATGEEISAKVAADGTFVWPNVPPGRWEVSVHEPPGWTLASATSAGADVLDGSLEVPRDRDVRDLVLTLTDRITEVSGTVTNTLARPVTDGTVILFPADERLWVLGARRIYADALESDGRFRFERMRPGTYRLALAESVEPDEWLDPQFLKKLLAVSVPVTIGAGDRKVQDLRVK